MEIMGIKEVPALIDVTCDICGQSCWDLDKRNLEYASLSASWGFYSNKDGTIHNCDICETCFDRVRSYIEQEMGGTIRENDWISNGTFGKI